MTDTARTSQQVQRHVHHGRTGAAWVGVTVAMIGFVVCGIAMVTGPNWTLLWIGLGVLVVALIATKIMQVLGHGAG